MNWYQPSLDLTVATCGVCGVETKYEEGSWKCQGSHEKDREDS